MYLFLITTTLAFLNAHSSIVSKLISKCINQTPKIEKQLFQERTKYFKEQSELSLSRDFVKHSKLQRRINKIDEQINESKSNRTHGTWHNIILEYGFKTFLSVIILFVMIYYRNVPVFIVDSEYDLWPFGGFISYPNDVYNAVSVHFWLICCSRCARLVKF